MSCEEFQKQLSALLDGELTAEAAAEVRSHLAGCENCSAAHNEMSAVLDLANEWPVEGNNVLASVQQRISQDEMQSVLLEMRRLRSEVNSLRSEITELKNRVTKRDVTPGRETSVLRFPYAGVNTITPPVL